MNQHVMPQSRAQGALPILEMVEGSTAFGTADATLLVWEADPRGLFACLREAEHSRRVVLPARWLPARSTREGGIGDQDRILWVARNNHALAQLLAPHDDGPAWLGDTARPDEPLALLGVPGDVVTSPDDPDARGIVRRTEQWIQKLGFDRVALAIPASAGAAHPLFQFARRRRIGVVRVGRPVDGELVAAGATDSPLLWTDFQLDTEHRLPDEDSIPGLRDLLHRGSLLRLRTLCDRLPQEMRDHLEAELRALYSWHVSPILRRAGALMQTLMPVAGVRWDAPLDGVRSNVGYLLGLCPKPAELSSDPIQDARTLVQALHGWDRRVTAQLAPEAWSALRMRLLPWTEAGHLAACQGDASRRRFCFSGQPLWTRVPLGRATDGVAALSLEIEDCAALGWFQLELEWGEAQSVSHSSSGLADVHAFPFAERREEDQLPLDLEGTGA